MKVLFKKVTIFSILMIGLSFTLDSDRTNYDFEIKKSIVQIEEGLYEVVIRVNNGDVVNGIARYEAKLPITAEFVKTVSSNETLSFSLDGRKVKMLWMHLQKNKSYTAIFQIKSKLSIDKLKMKGKLSGHQDGDKFSFDDTTSFEVF